jgi:hypothetical protein
MLFLGCWVQVSVKSQALVAHGHNPSYSGVRDQRVMVHGQSRQKVRPCLRNSQHTHTKGLAEWLKW